MPAEELSLPGIMSEAIELAASETAEAAELTASDTVLPKEDSEEAEGSEELSVSPGAVLSEDRVSSGPETVSSVSAASPVISPSGISELALEEATLELLLLEGRLEETELLEEAAEELEVSFLLPHPTIATAITAARVIKIVFFMDLFASR